MKKLFVCLSLIFSLSGMDTQSEPRKCRDIPLHAACLDNNFEKVKSLLEKGASVTETDKNGLTALHRACSYSYRTTTIVALLLQKGAAVSTKDKYGDTPLHEAAEHGDKELVELLIKHGAKVNLSNKLGQTAIQQTRSEEIATVLLNNHAWLGGLLKRRSQSNIKSPLHYYIPDKVASAIKKHPDYQDMAKY